MSAGRGGSFVYIDIIIIIVVIYTPISIDCTDLATYSYLDLQTGISLGPLCTVWLEDAEEIRTDEYDRLDASVDRVIQEPDAGIILFG
jgi:hypothetical protein